MEPTACRRTGDFPLYIAYFIRKRVRKVNISEENRRVFEGWRRNVQKCREVKNEK